ncbi:hypothetical protein EDC01DRAFT_420264 [Geopyxis carbonaria]|nr:hypothetical protein EDC01DRAFT_420264 [Geopyxis carbonaria]
MLKKASASRLPACLPPRRSAKFSLGAHTHHHRRSVFDSYGYGSGAMKTTLLATVAAAVLAGAGAARLPALAPDLVLQVREATPHAAVLPPSGEAAQAQVKLLHVPGAAATISTLITFNLPPSSPAALCALSLHLPPHHHHLLPQQSHNTWTITTPGWLDAWPLPSDARITPGTTTWATKPRWSGPALFRLYSSPRGGEARVVGNPVPCKAGERVAFELRPAGGVRGVGVEWSQLELGNGGVRLEMWS